MFERRLKSHHELYNITRVLQTGRAEVEALHETGPGCSREGRQYRLTQKGVYWGHNICDAFLKSLALPRSGD